MQLGLISDPLMVSMFYYAIHDVVYIGRGTAETYTIILCNCALLDLHLFISNDIVSTLIYDKRDDFDFVIVNFPFLDGDVPRSTSYGKSK